MTINTSKRKTTQILLSGLVLTTWDKPIVNAVILPAHAQTSIAFQVGVYGLNSSIEDGVQSNTRQACVIFESDLTVTYLEETVENVDGVDTITRYKGSTRHIPGASEIPFFVLECNNSNSQKFIGIEFISNESISGRINIGTTSSPFRFPRSESTLSFEC